MQLILLVTVQRYNGKQQQRKHCCTTSLHHSPYIQHSYSNNSLIVINDISPLYSILVQHVPHSEWSDRTRCGHELHTLPPRCFIKYEPTYLDVLTLLHLILNSYKPPSYSSLLTLTTVHLLHLSPHKSTFNPSLKLDFKHKKGNKTQERHMVNIK